MNKKQKQKGGEHMKNPYIVTLVAVIVVGAGAFFAGMQYQKTQSRAFGYNGMTGQNSFFNQRSGQNGGMMFQGRNSNNGYRPVIGKVVSTDKDSVTVETNDGSSKIIILSSTTSYVRTDKAAVADVKVGQEISVFGKENNDGSVTAQNIQLNPQLRTPMNGRSGSPTP